VAGAFGLSRYLAEPLFAAGKRDPLTFGGIALILPIIAITATAVPRCARSLY
jgi:hypothetical protein